MRWLENIFLAKFRMHTSMNTSMTSMVFREEDEDNDRFFYCWIVIMSIPGDVLYILYYFWNNNQVQLIRYIGFILLDSWLHVMHRIEIVGVAQKNFERLRVSPNRRWHIAVRQQQFFSFISRLEATLVPIYFDDETVRTKSVNIGFFILFDFFDSSS
jgi:hypothetical protein